MSLNHNYETDKQPIFILTRHNICIDIKNYHELKLKAVEIYHYSFLNLWNTSIARKITVTFCCSCQASCKTWQLTKQNLIIHDLDLILKKYNIYYVPSLTI